MNNKINAFLLYILGTASIMPLATTTHAGQIYMYKDSNGSTLLTNRKSADRSLTKVKVTYYPDSNIHSYRNWGNSEASVLPSYSRNKNAFDHIIQQAAQQHGVSEGLIKAVMHTESGFNVNARSPVGAQGLMQLMPATARRFNVSNAYDPHENIMAGAKYLAWLLKRFNGNTTLALAGYNAGEGNVAKYGGVPPFRETQDYVRRVTSRYSNLYANGVSASANNNAITANNNSNTQSQNAQVIAQSDNYTASNHQVAANKRPQRQIIMAADGRFTDAPAGSYATGNATASARIFISE
ncbi:MULTISPECIES: lytic transglycosylase domain-containing protein [Acinetobacter]|uniref:Lytic transglycosylase domain-containing protein n=1 Tax=Acinetobacter towneri TaxID=202956 RepID=A0ABX7TCF1_9GAMM|nr:MULTISPECIES: lytic transglycosylase domain-containing protein [Acinetobacter]MCO8058385.1 lytic transglycosylase domain-containing protein [Acinetobacter towneri]MCO8063948.1 lytic transglycosylase domain-containing protein [Acinetobacter towneri]PCN61609.1 transglycosylase [Acinetobacter sp. YT-02]QTD60186.1 lytic transglycosylase domain-containing protein [Acinetobacter towneri]QTD61245.1 lytic transglycosylase domain-containing protein [Acinetobacter towneri]